MVKDSSAFKRNEYVTAKTSAPSVFGIILITIYLGIPNNCHKDRAEKKITMTTVYHVIGIWRRANKNHGKSSSYELGAGSTRRRRQRGVTGERLSPLHSRVARRIAHAHTSSRFSRRGACGGGDVVGGGRRARDPWLRVLLGGQSPLTHAGRARRTPDGPPTAIITLAKSRDECATISSSSL